MKELEFEQLKKKVNVLEKEVEELKSSLHLKTSEQISDSSKPHTNKVSTQTANSNDLQKSVKKEPVDWERHIGQVWLPRIFLFVLLLGVVWGFKAATDMGVITDSVKCILGFSVAGLLYWLGGREVHKDRRALGIVLLGGSISLLMLTTFAVHFIYDYISPTPAFLLNVIWIALGVVTALKKNSQALAVFITIGGYLVPFLIDSPEPNIYVFAGYELILSLAVICLARWKDHTVLFYVAFGLLHITYAVFNLLAPNNNDVILLIGILIQHIAILTLFIPKARYSKPAMRALYPSLGLTLLWSYSILNSEQFDLTLLVSVMVYGILSVIFTMKDHASMKAGIVLSISSLTFMICLLRLFSIEEVTTLLLIHGVISIFLGYSLKANLQLYSGLAIYSIAALITLNLNISQFLSYETLSWIMLIITQFMIMKIGKDYERKEVVSALVNVMGSCILVSLLIFISKLSMVVTGSMSYNAQHLFLSLSWTLYAIMIVGYGILRNNKKLRLVGIGMMFFTLIKLIFVDLPVVSISVRALLFVGLGLVGIALSRIFYRSNK